MVNRYSTSFRMLHSCYSAAYPVQGNDPAVRQGGACGKSGEKINTIFAEQPYLANVYPEDTRNIGIIFELKDFTIESFNLGVKPIFREVYAVGQAETEKKGYRITDACIGCGTCLNHCPQKCIVSGEQYTIQPEHCLHCGVCYENCPVKAVEKL